MSTLVTVNAHDGVLRRYETGGEKHRLTHQAVAIDPPVTFTPNQVENFRIWPDDEFKVDPPPRPTMPPANSGAVYQEAA